MVVVYGFFHVYVCVVWLVCRYTHMCGYALTCAHTEVWADIRCLPLDLPLYLLITTSS